MDRNQLIFFEEARDLLTELEETTLAIEHDPENMDLIGRIFRAIHTLKGSSSMFGCDVIAHFAHDVENAFDCVRQGKMTVTPKLITLTLASRDHIALLFQDLLKEKQPSEKMIGAGDEILAELRTLLPQSNVEPTALRAMPETGETVRLAPQKKSVYRIRWRPPQNIYLTGSNPQYLIDELTEMGACEVILHSDGLPPAEELNPDFCYFRWDLLLTTEKDDRAIRDVFIFVEDDSELRIDLLGDADYFDNETRQEIIDVLSSIEDAPIEHLKAIVAPHRLQAQPAAVHADQQQQPTAQQQVSAQQQQQQGAPQQDHKDKGIQSIKVPPERLDKLVDLVGELVIVQARLSQAATSSFDPLFRSIAEQVEALVWELRDNAMSIRMLPIGTTFTKFNRLVRDLAAELGKEIQLVTEGEETELDKTVIERLGDPLVHMIRNCIDHGIETPAERLAGGKPRAGMIRLSAVHAGAFVNISITDDGRGLDSEAIFNKAVSQGLIGPDAQLTNQELYALIFRPGFSTNTVVTNVSGRGVGMDVVRRSIDDLGGQIEVTSKLNKGTTILLKIPLTMAIVEGLLVQVGRNFYILPLSIVKECVELPSVEERRGNGGELINVRGDIVPYIRLHDYYGSPDPVLEHEYVVIVEYDKTSLGFAVDVVCGQHQTVIKRLGAMYSGVKGVSGATILGDGTVALIVDVPAIVTEIQHEVRQPAKPALSFN